MINFENIKKKLSQGQIYIILEGPDGVGKTTVIGMLFQILHQHIPYSTFLCRNPTDQIYKIIKSGNETPYNIGMMTLTDAIEQRRDISCSLALKNKIVIQDRSAIISGFAYNRPLMSKSEQFAYDNHVKSMSDILLSNSVIVFLTSDRKPDNLDIFESDEIQSMVKIAYADWMMANKDKFNVGIIRNDNVVDTAEEILQRISE